MTKLLIFGAAFVAFLLGGMVVLTPKEVSEDFKRAAGKTTGWMFTPGRMRYSGWVAIIFGVVFLVAGILA